MTKEESTAIKKELSCTDIDIYLYIEETIEYFDRLDINIEKIMQRIGNSFKKKLPNYTGNRQKLLEDLTNNVSEQVVNELEKRKSEPDEKLLADYVMKASLSALLYTTRGYSCRTLDEFMADFCGRA